MIMESQAKWHYRYFNAEHARAVDMTDNDAMIMIGNRTASGWQIRQAFVEAPDGTTSIAVWCLNHDGSVWSLWVEIQSW
jgi:hypothetical protein